MVNQEERVKITQKYLNQYPNNLKKAFENASQELEASSAALSQYYYTHKELFSLPKVTSDSHEAEGKNPLVSKIKVENTGKVIVRNASIVITKPDGTVIKIDNAQEIII